MRSQAGRYINTKGQTEPFEGSSFLSRCVTGSKKKLARSFSRPRRHLAAGCKGRRGSSLPPPSHPLRTPYTLKTLPQADRSSCGRGHTAACPLRVVCPLAGDDPFPFSFSAPDKTRHTSQPPHRRRRCTRKAGLPGQGRGCARHALPPSSSSSHLSLCLCTLRVLDLASLADALYSSHSRRFL